MTTRPDVPGGDRAGGEPSGDDQPGDGQVGENTCPDCAGTGSRDGGRCSTCDGDGTVVEIVGDA